jgi:hypothetical protein
MFQLSTVYDLAHRLVCRHHGTEKLQRLELLLAGMAMTKVAAHESSASSLIARHLHARTKSKQKTCSPGPADDVKLGQKQAKHFTMTGGHSSDRRPFELCQPSNANKP